MRDALLLAVATLAVIFGVGALTLDDPSQVASEDFVGTVALALPFLTLAGWAWASGDRRFALVIAASSVLLAVPVRAGGLGLEKGDLVPIPVEVGIAYLLFRLGRTVWRRWRARQLQA